MRLSEIVKELIRLGNASHAYWDRELPKYHPHYPLVRDGEQEVPPSPEDDQMLALLTGLSEDQLYAIALLAYIGRGDFTADNLPRAHQSVKEWFPNKDVAIDQLTASKALDDYLTDAMEELEKRHIDLDGIDFVNALSLS